MKGKLSLVFLMTMALAAFATAQTKIAGTLQCAKSDPSHSIEVGDKPGHVMVVEKAACTWAKPLEMGGSQTKDGVSVQTMEVSGGKSSGSGTHWGTMVSGDKYFVRFQGKATLDKDGVVQSVNGTWSYTGGTGKLKGLQGKGTYKSGKANADGGSTVEIEGDYKLPK
jgi:hypothetical protein